MPLFIAIFILIAGSIFGSDGNFNILSADTDKVSIDYQFDGYTVTQKDGFHYFNQDNCQPILDEGEPLIPVKTVRILIPEGKSIDKIKTTQANIKCKGSYNLNTVQKSLPIGQEPTEIITFSGTFPKSSYQLLATTRCKGYDIAVIRLFPFSYNSHTRSVSYTNNINLEVTFKEERRVKSFNQDLKPRGLKKDMEYISTLVDNSYSVEKYTRTKRALTKNSQTYEYIIITNSTLKTAFEPFAEFIRSNRDLTVGIFDIDDITTNISHINYHEGRDKQEQIRNFIKYAYANYDTQYVLLGGYARIIPVRYLYQIEKDINGKWVIEIVPGDIYYSNLDGDWDNNKNDNFGERPIPAEQGNPSIPGDGEDGGYVDTEADVFVGRAPVWNVTDLENFTKKVMHYNTTDNWKLKTAGFIGKKLSIVEPTWGGDALDGIIRDIMPDDWDVRRFYQRDNTFTVGAVKRFINQGAQILTGLAHGGAGSCNGFSISDIRSLRNEHFFINYSQSCQSGHFDHPSDGPCIAEYMVNEPYAAVAFIGNARSGFYHPTIPEIGLSNVLNKEFFNLLFNHNVTILGEAYHKHKDNYRSGGGSWKLYYYMHLFGDPSMPIMEPRISPSDFAKGSTYFVKDNNIWKYNLETKKREQLTKFPAGSGDIQNPSLTEDGEKIFFTRVDSGNSRLYQINPDGSGEEDLTDLYDLSALTVDQADGVLSPSGEILAFVAKDSSDPNGGTQLWVKELTGIGGLRKLTSNNWNCSYPTFVSDTYLLFKTKNILDNYEDYYLITTVGTNLTNKTENNHPNNQLGRPSLNKEKTKIIYGKRIWHTGYWIIYTQSVWEGSAKSELSINETDPRDPMPIFVTDRELIYRGISELTGELNLYHTVFNSTAPQSDPIPLSLDAIYPQYFSLLPKPSQFVYVKNNQIYLRTDKGTDLQLTDTTNSNNDPTFDFYSVYIAYSGNGIWVMRANGTDTTQIEETFEARYPAFSPDGNWVIYVKNNDIYARKKDKTTQPQRLTNMPSYQKSDLSFSPDGKKILFTMVSSKYLQIYTLPVTIFDNSIQVNDSPFALTDTTNLNNYHPTWSPKGEQIIYISTQTGSPAIFTMLPDGTNKEQPTFSKIPENPSFPVFSPYSENKISYINNGQIWTAYPSNQYEEMISPAISTTKKFSWVQSQTKKIQTKRQFILNQADPSTEFTYNIIVTPNLLTPATNIVLEETLPSIPDAGTDWTLTKAYWNGEELMPSNGATTGKLKWAFEAGDIPIYTEGEVEIPAGTMTLTVTLTGDGPIDSIRSLNGGVTIIGDKFYSTSGDTYINIGEPYIPADINGDWKIDDKELLEAIDYWATNTRIGGWPVDTKDWDMYILHIINFWINDGYEYVPGEDRWKTN